MALAGCTAFDVITILRQKHHQKVTGYEVRVEADQAERPPQVFTAVRIHHVVTGFGIDPAAVEQAIRLSEEKHCSVGAMVKQTATDVDSLMPTGTKTRSGHYCTRPVMPGEDPRTERWSGFAKKERGLHAKE